MLDTLKIYEKLKSEFLAFSEAKNPPKASIEISDGEESDFRYINFLPSVLRDGTYGVKVIDVNETDGRSHGHVHVYEETGKYLGSIQSSALTPYRCGLMTALTIDLFFDGFDNVNTIGLIGTGAINSSVFATLSKLAPEISFIAKGSPRAPFKNSDNFNGAFLTDNLPALSPCDVIVTATTCISEIEVIDFDPEVFDPRLYIAHDAGYLLGPSYRELPSFSDYPAQVDAHFKFNFPYDKKALFTAPSNGDEFSADEYQRAVCYNEGIGLADIVVARELLKCQP